MDFSKKCVSGVLVVFVFVFLILNMSYANPDKVKIPNGTPVVLRVVEEVNSKLKNINENINLEVALDVVIDSKIVVKAGTPGLATVTLCQKTGMVGKAGMIQFSVDSTKAVDGQNIPLRATLTQGGKDETATAVAGGVICCPLFLLMSGKDASFPVGTEVKSYTAGDVTVEVQ